MSALSPIADILGLRDSKKKATGTMAGPPVHLQDFCSFPSWEYASTVALTPVSSDPRNCLSQTCIRMGVTQGRWHSWRPCCLWLRLLDPNRRLLRTRRERPRSRYNSRPFDEIASSHWLAPMAKPRWNYSRDLRSTKWGSGVSLNSSNFHRPMSALGHKRTLGKVRPMSALPPIADIPVQKERDRHDGRSPQSLAERNKLNVSLPIS